MFRYAATVFISAFLLFQVQPLLGRYILPWFGGGPSIWTTCMLFFQLVLLGGYLYAHVISVRCSARTQGMIHLALLGMSLAFLPITPSAAWKPTASELPVARILLLLLATVGGPYLVLSSTGPLLQQWFSRSEPGKSPYRLYSLSNIGSLLALLSYPFLFEPWLTLRVQVLCWSGMYVLFVIFAGWCALRIMKDAERNTSEAKNTAIESPQSQQRDRPSDSRFDDEPKRPNFIRMLLWLLLAAFGSLVLLGTTNQLCLDVATVPFLWVLPLTLYLLSFIICFDNPKHYDRRIFGGLLVLAAPMTHYLLTETVDVSLFNQILMYSTVMFACCMGCHGELVRARPHPRYLTLFYLLVSAGGALGGLFVAVIAPVIFDNYWEYHCAVFGCMVLTLLAWIYEYFCSRDARGEEYPTELARNLQFWAWVIGVAAFGGSMFYFNYLPIEKLIDDWDQTILFSGLALIIFTGLHLSAEQASKPFSPGSGFAIGRTWGGFLALAALWIALLAYSRFWNGIASPTVWLLALVGNALGGWIIGYFCSRALVHMPTKVTAPLIPTVSLVGTIGLVGWLLKREQLDRTSALIVAGMLLVCGLVDWSVVRLGRSGRSWRFWLWGPVLAGLVLFGVSLWDIIHAREEGTIHRSRNFYGVLRVEYEDGDFNVHEHGPRHRLTHGQIQHGFQFLDAQWRMVPTSYYARDSGVGVAILGMRELMAKEQKKGLQVACVGLGTGTLAVYGEEGDHFRFYEINREVQKLTGKYFTHLIETPAKTEVLIGDARITMENQIAAGQTAFLDILAIDAFSSDAIPVHLLTTECAEIYRQLLKPSGVLAVHISNRFLALEPITRGMARHLGWRAVQFESEEDEMQGVFTTTWVLLTNNQEFLQLPRVIEGEAPWPNDQILTWTDDYSGLWKILK